MVRRGVGKRGGVWHAIRRGVGQVGVRHAVRRGVRGMKGMGMRHASKDGGGGMQEGAGGACGPLGRAGHHVTPQPQIHWSRLLASVNTVSRHLAICCARPPTSTASLMSPCPLIFLFF